MVEDKITYKELKRRFNEESYRMKKECKHETIDVEEDTSQIGCGTGTSAIVVTCRRCEEKIYIWDFEDGKAKRDFIKKVKKGKVKFMRRDWNTGRIDVEGSKWRRKISE